MDAPPWPFFQWRKNVLATLLLVPVILIFFSCHSRPKAEHAFYYWKTTFAPTAAEKQALKTHDIGKLYVRYFDVTWDRSTQKPIPTAIIRIKDTSVPRTIIPVVFITNETLLKADSGTISKLASNIPDLILQFNRQNQLGAPKEIQLDCDWTAGTRDRYFQLLAGIREWLRAHDQAPVLSATIRLYQCKYHGKTGIPPVDKGLLMCYNMGNLKAPTANNSILDPEELKKYTGGLGTYPLPLDLALPIFDWKVLYRDNRYAGLVEGLPTPALSASPAISIKDNRYTFRQELDIGGYSFRQGDQLRDEQSDYDAIIEAAAAVSRRLKNKPSTIILYHLDSANLSKYSFNELETIFDRCD